MKLYAAGALHFSLLSSRCFHSLPIDSLSFSHFTRKFVRFFSSSSSPYFLISGFHAKPFPTTTSLIPFNEISERAPHSR
jgi:hypothetical protein